MKTTIKILCATILVLTSFKSWSQNNDINEEFASGGFSSIKIGEQEWIVENLNVERFRNGDLIPQAKTDAEWETAGYEGKPVWCYYENNAQNNKKYGKLYNWYAVNDPRGLAPDGWHIPNKNEWTTLIKHLGGKMVAGAKMKASDNWNKEGNGTNESGFNAIPAGDRDYAGSIGCIGLYSFWWSANESNSVDAIACSLSYKNNKVSINSFDKLSGFSVRCIKD